MHLFRAMSLRLTGRVLGLLLAYVLVVYALLVPLRAFAAAMPDGDTAVLCLTDGLLGAQKKTLDGLDRPHTPFMQHDCEAGCFMPHGSAVKNTDSNYFILLEYVENTHSIIIEKTFIRTRHRASLLALGKAPGAPPDFLAR